MALQTRPLARAAGRNGQIRAETNASPLVSRMRHAGRRHSDEMPPVRREHELLPRRSQQVPGALDAANLSRDLRAAYHLLRHVYPFDDHLHAEARFSLA